MAGTEQTERDRIERSSPRRNMLLSAEIETARAICKVLLRNVSETGVLVEGSGLPGPGEALTLRKGAFEITGSVAWAMGTRCGVRFDSAVDIRSLVEGQRRSARPAGAHQSHVDALQAKIRSGLSLAEERPFSSAHAPRPPALVDKRLAEELGYVARLLDVLADQLVADPIVINRHGPALQSLDLANQLLGHVANVLVAADREAAIAAIGNAELRARLNRAGS